LPAQGALPEESQKSRRLRRRCAVWVNTPTLRKERERVGHPPDSTGVEYVYDLVGKIKQVTDPSGVYGFAYDNMGRFVGTSTQYSFLPSHTFSNAYTYDAASNRTGFTAPDGSMNTYGYDTLNRLSGLTNSLTGQFGFSYDALSRRTQLTRPNGVNT
jgi:YD repeat-containing protein